MIERHGIDAKAAAPVIKCANYLVKNTRWLHYDRALADGLPIATGVIEGACRYLAQDRMGRTGARWSLGGAEAILRLRALRTSGDFADYWQNRARVGGRPSTKTSLKSSTGTTMSTTCAPRSISRLSAAESSSEADATNTRDGGSSSSARCAIVAPRALLETRSVARRGSAA
jgi:hypothetical protein